MATNFYEIIQLEKQVKATTKDWLSDAQSLEDFFQSTEQLEEVLNQICNERFLLDRELIKSKINFELNHILNQLKTLFY